jgi:hypothetical protein
MVRKNSEMFKAASQTMMSFLQQRSVHEQMYSLDPSKTNPNPKRRQARLSFVAAAVAAAFFACNFFGAAVAQQAAASSSLGSWSTAVLSVARSGIAAASLFSYSRRLPNLGIAIFAGGTTLSSPSNAVDMFNATAGAWNTVVLSVARSGLAATSLPNVAVAIFAGGADASSSYNVVDIFNAAPVPSPSTTAAPPPISTSTPGPLPTPPAGPSNVTPDSAAASEFSPGSKAALAIFFIAYFANIAGVVYYCRKNSVRMQVPLACAATACFLCWIVILFVMPKWNQRQQQGRSNLTHRML